MGRREKKPQEQGHAPAIRRLLVDPLLQLMPRRDDLGPKEWLEACWGTKFRDVERYVALRNCALEGLLLVAAQVPIQGIGNKQIKAGDELWARTDTRTPDVVHVENQNGPSGSTQVWLLSELQWGRLKANLEERATCEKKSHANKRKV